MNTQQLADDLQALSDRIRVELDQATRRARDWQPGPTPGDSHHTPPQPGDPDYTGPLTTHELDQILTDQQLDDRRSEARAARIHHTLRHTLDDLERARRRLDQLLDLLATKHPPRGQPTPANAGDGWCRSCYRNAGHLEPIATRPDGRARYEGLCRFCGEWAAAHDGNHPPLPILRERHAGRRITQALVDRVSQGGA